jgi:hypothetical protein
VRARLRCAGQYTSFVGCSKADFRRLVSASTQRPTQQSRVTTEARWAQRFPIKIRFRTLCSSCLCGEGLEVCRHQDCKRLFGLRSRSQGSDTAFRMSVCTSTQWPRQQSRVTTEARWTQRFPIKIRFRTLCSSCLCGEGLEVCDEQDCKPLSPRPSRTLEILQTQFR